MCSVHITSTYHTQTWQWQQLLIINKFWLWKEQEEQKKVLILSLFFVLFHFHFTFLSLFKCFRTVCMEICDCIINNSHDTRPTTLIRERLMEKCAMLFCSFLHISYCVRSKALEGYDFQWGIFFPSMPCERVFFFFAVFSDLCLVILFIASKSNKCV